MMTIMRMCSAILTIAYYIALFIDGISKTGTTSGVINDTTMPLLIGKRNDIDGRGFPVNGLIDEVAIWNRALSDAEISNLYNDGAGYAVVPLPGAVWLLGPGLLGLVGWRRFKRN
jgi:hypothetical protein